MSVSEAQKRATLKWQKEKTDEVRFRVPKGERARIQAHAEQHGESATAFIKRAIREAMERDNAAKWINLLKVLYDVWFVSQRISEEPRNLHFFSSAPSTSLPLHIP